MPTNDSRPPPLSQSRRFDRYLNPRVLAPVLVLIVCAGLAAVFVRLAEDPPRRPPEEPVLAVRLQTVSTTNVATRIESHGQVRPIREIDVAAQVGGSIVEMPEILKQGDLLAEGDVIAQIDSEEYLASLKEAQASVAGLEATLTRLDLQETSDKRRRDLAQRSLTLAEDDFNRLKRLSANGNAVSLSTVESAERQVTDAASRLEQLEQSLALLPARRKETRAELDAARARVDRARLNLKRTTITSPFTGRIVETYVDEGSTLQPGQAILRLADDQALEIPVPVTATELRRWIPFETERDVSTAWFPPLPDLPVSITWSEGDEDHEWTGRLDRVMEFDPTTRTAMIAVRVNGGARSDGTEGLPLTAGMFTRVVLPGRQMKQVIRLPRSAVTFEGHAYISENGRLKTVEVEVVRSDDTSVYVSKGLRPGDQVVVTRLVAPLEGARLVETEDQP